MQRFLTPRDFGRRVSLSTTRVRELLRRELIPGALKTPNGQWRIKEESVESFLGGYRNLCPESAPNVEEFMDRLWLRYEGRRYHRK